MSLTNILFIFLLISILGVTLGILKKKKIIIGISLGIFYINNNNFSIFNICINTFYVVDKIQFSS